MNTRERCPELLAVFSPALFFFCYGSFKGKSNVLQVIPAEKDGPMANPSDIVCETNLKHSYYIVLSDLHMAAERGDLILFDAYKIQYYRPTL